MKHPRSCTLSTLSTLALLGSGVTARAQFTTLTIRYTNGIDGTDIVGYYIDSNSVSHGFLYSVPEPGSVALLAGIAVAGAGSLTRRRRKRSQA